MDNLSLDGYQHALKTKDRASSDIVRAGDGKSDSVIEWIDVSICLNLKWGGGLVRCDWLTAIAVSFT